jgi:hypothetical protein
MKANLLLHSVFVAIAIMPVVSNAENPTGVATTTDVTTPGKGPYTFTVRYTDDGAVNIYTIDSNDVRITGPRAFDSAVKLVGPPSVIATYSLVPPGGSWDSGDNGTYTVVMQAAQVFDGIGNAVQPGPIGSFRVSISGPPPPTPTPGQPLNISTRMNVKTDDQVLIAGFIVDGNDPKKVIIRAIGPSLADLGITNALADPILELHGAGGSLITSNNNWKDAQQSDIEASGIQPTSDLESAIVATLNPGSYTAIMKGENGGTGIGLVEAYDLDQAADSQLANISTRGFVDDGAEVMIAGFILGNGDGARSVLIRALGPSLTAAGVKGALADPTLELHDENGALLMSNDNWKDSQQSEIEATGIAPEKDSEAAILTDLLPAAYTAIVAGKNGLVGVALVEVYRLR